MKKIIALATLATLILSSCTKETEGLIKDPNLMEFDAELAYTRATATEFEAGDVIGVYVSQYEDNKPTPLQVSGNYASNISSVYNGEKWVNSIPIYWSVFKHDRFHSVYRLKDCETHEELTDVMELHFIELKKMKDVKHIEEIKTKLEAWLYFINQPESELVQELEKVEVDIKEAKDELIRLSGDKEERARYEKRRESLLNKVSALKNAEEKGIRQGARKEKIEIAKNLLDILDNETISLKTGLSVSEVQQLRKG